MGRFRKSSATKTHRWLGQHRFEHWYRDNTLYFITSRVSNKSPAFASDEAKRIFWGRFDFYSKKYCFEPWVRTLMDNHYHFLGRMGIGENLGPFMQHLHGSVAKLVNDLLPERIVPFWKTSGNQDYFDGCLRDEIQLCRTHKYVRLQAVRAGVVDDYRKYAHTFIDLRLPDAMKRAKELGVYLPEVPYARYDGRRTGRFSDQSRPQTGR